MAKPTKKKSLLNSDIQAVIMEGKIEAGIESQKKIERKREIDKINLMREITEGKLEAQGRGKYGGGGKLIKGLLELGRNLKAKASDKVRKSVDEGEVEIGLTNLDAFDYEDAIKMYQNGDLTLAEVNKNLKSAGYDGKDISDFMYVLSDTSEDTAQGSIEKRTKLILKQDRDRATDKRMKELTPPSEEEVEVMLDDMVERGEFKTGGLLEDDRQMYSAAGKIVKKLFKRKPSKQVKDIKELEQTLDNDLAHYRKLEDDYVRTVKEAKESGASKEEIKSLDITYKQYFNLFDENINTLKEELEELGVNVSNRNIKEKRRFTPGEAGDITEPLESLNKGGLLSDKKMEENYTRFIMDEALSEEEEDMLVTKLEQDKELQMLFDKVIDVAQEFAGNGPVEGPGTGVSDDIPARLSDGEFVFTAKAVEEIGEDTLMSMMKEAEAEADKRQGFNMGEMVDEDEMLDNKVGITSDMRKVNPRLNSNLR